ncbi:hypothetical protein HFP15_03770 [Amycolatopsis sp. K13G38]|uniref:Uncharacterized protein n=1 Tax=Amycolatopsis acididurans TaxID=2724524 RepID=A0ABX1J0X6_9PSEU|nr:hypothetical protein [Amycolatopsis acididurans]NKQ51995.1 hypothetical protein [Amycolatopsis acididurans]
MQRNDVVPGGLIVVSVESVGPGSVEGCWECGLALGGGEVVVRVCELAAPGERYLLHRHCVELRYQDRPRFVPVPEHAETFARVVRAVNALTELNVPGDEFEELIDELADSFAALRALVES